MSTYVTDLTHFLTEEGAIAQTMPSPAKRLAEFLASIVVNATSPPSVKSTAPKIGCFRHPGKKRCAGEVETDISPSTEAVEWSCPMCGNNGTISNWRGTLWDRMGDGTAH
jgi:hypothetical protein